MSAVISPPEQVVLLRNTTWETYQRLLAERGESANPRFTFDRGVLEIMTVFVEHERAKGVLTLLFELMAFEFGIDFENTGSTTFQREDLDRGFEPDASFYLRNPERIRGLKRLDLSVDPAPDLLIEIDITHSSLNKLSVFAAVGVPEVWRYDGRNMFIFKLEGSTYEQQPTSHALPGVTREVLESFLANSEDISRLEWMRTVREWAANRR